MDFIKPYLSRIIGSALAAFFAWLAAKNVNVDSDTQQQASAALIGVATAVAGIVYSIVHKYVDKWINPGDAAASANVTHGIAVKAGE